MKHLFIVNPIAGGKRSDYRKTIDMIEGLMAAGGKDYEIYITSGVWDAVEKVKKEAEQGSELRVYACGGDGTFNECVNGAAGFDNASVTVFPCGTGNDFIKIFGEEKEDFYILENLINGFVHPIDIIRVNDRYSVNICSVGLDARVGTEVHKYSRLSGTGAYIVSLLVNYVKGINREFTVTVNGEKRTGEYALICACNGRYYGGGFNPVPDAMPDDGVMDTLLVGKCSRLKILTVIKKYATGRSDEIPELVKRINTGKIEIESDSDIAVNLDGELLVSKKAVFELIPGGVNLICPAGMKFFDSVRVISNKQKIS